MGDYYDDLGMTDRVDASQAKDLRQLLKQAERIVADVDIALGNGADASLRPPGSTRGDSETNC